MHSCIIWWFCILLNSYDKCQTKINREFIFQEKFLLIRYQLLWAKSNWPINFLKDWKRNKNIVFNSKKHKFVLLMVIHLSLRQTLRRLRRILMKSGFALSDITCCYMFVLMTNVLRQKCQGMRITVDIMASL